MGTGPFSAFAAGQSAGHVADFGHAIADQVMQTHAKALVDELSTRSKMIEDLQKVEQDPTYDQQSREMARNYIYQLKFLKPTDKRPKEFTPDKEGRIPALVNITYRKVLKNGPDQPAQPADPNQPGAGGASMGAGAGAGTGPGAAIPPMPSIPELGITGSMGGMSVDGGAAPQPAGLPPMPGGVQPVPGRISPAPAVPAPATVGGGAGYSDMMDRVQPNATGLLPPMPNVGLPPDGMVSTRRSPRDMALEQADTQAAVEEYKRNALAKSLEKMGVPKDLIQRAIVDSISGVNMPGASRTFLPQKLVLKQPDGSLKPVMAEWRDNQYYDAMTHQPLQGEVAPGVQWIDLGDKRVLVDAVGNALGPEAVKSRQMFTASIDPVTGERVFLPIKRSASSLSTGSGGTGGGGIPPVPKVTEGETKPAAATTSSPKATAAPTTAEPAAAPATPTPAPALPPNAEPESAADLFPGDDVVSQTAYAVANGNQPLPASGALRNRVTAAINNAGVILLEPKQKEAVADATNVRTMVGTMRRLVQTIQDNPADVSSINLLNSTIDSIRGILAKGVFRETGVLTDADIARAGALLPGGKTAALEGVTGIMREQPFKKLDELDALLRQKVGVWFRGRKGRWIAGMGKRSNVVPTATPEIIHAYADRLGNNAQKVRAALAADGWEIPSK